MLRTRSLTGTANAASTDGLLAFGCSDAEDGECVSATGSDMEATAAATILDTRVAVAKTPKRLIRSLIGAVAGEVERGDFLPDCG